MNHSVVNQAREWGFNCQLTDTEEWEITSPIPREKWKLINFKERWLLFLKNTPQIYLSDSETFNFLQTRYHLLDKKTLITR